jgi:Carboxypeptidase regulatory-like domain/TonB dependent receptor
MHQSRLTRLLLFCFSLICCSCIAQAPQAVLSTSVSDQTGAALPHVEVDLQDAKGSIKKTQTDERGRFMLPVVAGQRYQLTLHADGFRTCMISVVGGQLLPPVRLVVRDHSEQVTVQGDEAAALDLQQTQAGTVLNEQQVANVPLNGRSFTDLLAITPGVVPVSSAQPNAVVMSGVASTPPSGDLDIGALSVSGQRETANAFRVNGSDVQEDVNMGIAIVPTLDSIAELQVLTDSFDAKLGNQGGGQILVTTRSGEEHLHGSVYDYFRNTALDARSYFSLTRAPFHQNQFGGTLGGPTSLRRLKFFADYQGTRQTQGIDTGVVAVPSIEDRSGNLSDTLTSLTGTVSGDSWAQTLSQRLGYRVTNGEPYSQVFATGQIPQSAWSAPAKTLLPYIPQPNRGTNSFASSSFAQTVRDDKGALRLDIPSRFGQLSLYGFVDDYSLLNPYPTAQGGASVPGFNARNDGRAQLYAANLATVFGSDMVNTAHFSYMRNAATVGQPLGGQGVSLASQGFVTGAGTSGIVPQMPSIEGVENIVFNEFTMGTTVTGLSQAENIFEGSEDMSRALGTHLLSFGASFHADQINTHPNVYDNGSFSFTGSETGSDFADFLLGVDSSYTQGDGQNFYNRNHYLGLYAQDSWRVKSSLTLNYGLRWDLLPPWHEKYNQLLSLDPNEQSVVFPNAPKGIVFPGDPGVPNTISPTRYTNFAPRVAAAWSPTGHGFGTHGTTIVRAGYGIYYSAFEGLSAGIMSGNPPYGFTDTTAAPTLFEQPFVEASTGQSLGQPFPLQHVPFGASVEHPITSVDWSKYEPLTGIPAFAKNNGVPYAENYTFAVERQLGPATTVTLSYVGTQAHHLLVIQEANPGDPALCLSLSHTSEVAPGSATCGPFNESSTFVAASGPVYQGTRTAFSSSFGSVNLQKTIANAHDNAFEINLRHTAHSLYVELAYTWSKSIDQSSSLAEAVYPGDAGLSRAISAFDMTHNFSATYRYELPLAALAPDKPRLVQGWQISGLTRFGTGLPVTLVNNNDTSLLGTAPNGINNNGIDEPEYTPGTLQINHRPGSNAFNTSRFSLPALGTLGNARRRFFYGPGVDNTDLALSKTTRIHDAATLELRVEAFNVFNHGQFFGPSAVNGNLSSANFGQIQTASPPRLLQISARIQF